ncbi:MAG: hypothetical protein SNG35_01250 [Rikenellaceae bacterium]
MRPILYIILVIVPMLSFGQRMEIYTYESFKYIALYAYGLQRDVVKTNAEMKAAQMNGDGTGVMRRHHTTKGFDERIGNEGYNANDKISFAFMIAPRNVDVDGTETTKAVLLTWAEASGWDTSLNSGSGEYYDTATGVGVGESILATEATGCAAYRGMNGKDNPGDWRLPTQREIQIMFTVIEQSLGYVASGEVDHEIIEGVYWTSTEFYSSDAPGSAWSISSITGQPIYDKKDNINAASGVNENRMARCVKDIYETINEQ